MKLILQNLIIIFWKNCQTKKPPLYNNHFWIGLKPLSCITEISCEVQDLNLQTLLGLVFLSLSPFGIMSLVCTRNSILINLALWRRGFSPRICSLRVCLSFRYSQHIQDFSYWDGESKPTLHRQNASTYSATST